MAEGDLYEQIIAAVDGVYGAREGRRALHAKGSWCEGTFTASSRAAELSHRLPSTGRARRGPDPVLERERPSRGQRRRARGVAASRSSSAAGGEETDILATTQPRLRHPDARGLPRAASRLRRPDPETGQPDFEKLGAWLGAHPETQTAIQATLGADPLASFATAPYFSPHTFFLVDADGERTPVRYRWIPAAGEERISDDEAAERGRDYLHDELSERLAARAGRVRPPLPACRRRRPLDDATAIWPDEREYVAAGRLEIERPVDDPEREDHIDVFDPLRLVDGVEPSDDPILHARRRAYSVSAYRRWGRPPGAAARRVTDVRRDFKRSRRLRSLGVAERRAAPLIRSRRPPVGQGEAEGHPPSATKTTGV